MINIIDPIVDNAVALAKELGIEATIKDEEVYQYPLVELELNGKTYTFEGYDEKGAENYRMMCSVNVGTPIESYYIKLCRDRIPTVEQMREFINKY